MPGDNRNLSSRLARALKEKGLNQTEFYQRCEEYFEEGNRFSASALRSYLKGEHKPSDEKISVMAKALGLDEEWLKNGKGTPVYVEEKKEVPVLDQKRPKHFATINITFNAGRKPPAPLEVPPEPPLETEEAAAPAEKTLSSPEKEPGEREEAKPVAEEERTLPEEKEEKALISKPEGKAEQAALSGTEPSQPKAADETERKAIEEAEQDTEQNTEQKTEEKAPERPPLESSLILQCDGSSIEITGITQRCREAWKKEHPGEDQVIRKLNVYVKPEMGKAYWVVNGYDTGEIDL